MTYLVDANVLSEATTLAPNLRVVRWLRQNEREIAVDPCILGGIRFGIHLLPAGRRRRRLEQWFSKGVARIVCLPWDAGAGLRWARLLADLRTSGGALPITDSLIAATALVHGLTVVTRHTRDFTVAGVKVLDPVANATAVARFEREGSTSQLTHPNTIALFDYGHTPIGLFYYAMEYLEGLSVSTNSLLT